MKYPRRPPLRRVPPFPLIYNNKSTEDSSRATFWVAGVLFFIFVVTLGSAVFYLTSEEETSQNKETELSSKTSTGLVSCEDWDCFADRAQNCDLSNFESTISIDFLGLNITTTTYYELRGMENEKCVFYFRTEEQHIKFTDEVQQKIDINATLEELAELEETKKGMNEGADLLEGRDAECLMNPNDLIYLFNNWERGDFSSEDSKFYNDCEGSFFDTELN